MNPYLQINEYSFPTSIIAGPKASQKITEQLHQQHLKKPLIVTDKGFITLPVFKNFVALLKDLQIAIYAEITGNPVVSHVLKGIEAYRAHHADCIVAIGGGAALDTAKLIGLLANNSGSLSEYEQGQTIENPIPYLVTVPTTAGTGSEVGRSAVVSDDTTHIKKIIFSPKLLAKTVFLDPELIIDLPASITAATGMDALTHLIESYLAKDLHPLCDGIALEGLKLMQQAFIKSYHFAKQKIGATEEHLIARNQMLHAAMMGAVAFQKGLGVTHSCAHALSTVCDLHHGLANGIMLPYAMRFNASTVPQKIKTLEQTLDIKTDLIHFLEDLKTQMSIPHKLREINVQENQLARLVDIAFADSCHQNNPRVVTKNDFVQLFQEAF